MKGLEVTFLKEDKLIYDLSESGLEEYEAKLKKEIEESDIGKALLADGFKLDANDWDDCTLALIYKHKES